MLGRFKDKVPKPATVEGEANDNASPAESQESGHKKRRKVSASSFFAPRSVDATAVASPAPSPPAANKDAPHTDELAAYLSLPQIEYQTEWDALIWWKENAKKFPNLSVMARQYLGCPATSATVERLFSQVGIAFSDRRKSAKANTLRNIVFAKMNLD